jgi:hypothetical protein
MVVDAKVVFISSVIFRGALLLVTLSVGTGAVFSFLLAVATRRNCHRVFLLVTTSSLDRACILCNSRVRQ